MAALLSNMTLQNGDVAKDYDAVSRKQYYAYNFRDFPVNLGIKRLVYAVNDQIGTYEPLTVLNFGSLSHYGFAAEVKRNSASGLSWLDGLAVSAVVDPGIFANYYNSLSF